MMGKSEKIRGRLNVFLFIALFFGCIVLGFLLSSLLFKQIGHSYGFTSYIISVIVGLFLYIVLAKVFFYIFSKTKYGKEHNFRRRDFLDATLEALNRIARGDFNISIAIRENDPFSEVAETVNDMAKKLSSMEVQRQDFISNVSHEIQSPLTSISGFAALLKSDSLTKEQREHYIEIIETESRRLSKLSDNLLKLSSLETENVPIAFKDFRLDKQLESAVLILEPQWIKKNIEINAELEKINIHGDEELLREVWINLIHNGVKFTPENGSINIKLYKENKKIICNITDNGPGISKEDQIHIFERFFKVDKSRDRSLGGNGLGLSLCKKIVELHHGEITIESDTNKGAAFIVTFPE